MLVLFVFGYMFYKLAFNYDKNPWIWAFAGAGSYIAIQLFVGFIIGVLYAAEFIPVMSEMMVNVIAIGVSSALVFLGYRFLKKKWDSEDIRFGISGKDEISNIGRDQD